MRRGMAPPESVCIVMLSAIGDAVHVLPVANALRRAWPETKISWVSQPVPKILVEGHHAVDELIVYHRRRGINSWVDFADWGTVSGDVGSIWHWPLQVYFKAGLITGMLPARRKLGFDTARARDANWLFTTSGYPPMRPSTCRSSTSSSCAIWASTPSRWSGAYTSRTRSVRLRPVSSASSTGRLAPWWSGRASPAKNWTPEGYARVLEELEFTHGLQPILVGGPSPVEREMADRILGLTKAHPLDTLGNDLRRAIYLLDGSALTVSPDTGPLHISRALETRSSVCTGIPTPRGPDPTADSTTWWWTDTPRFRARSIPCP